MPKLAVTEGSGKRVAILARVTPSVREGLEAAAGVSGRSLSQEIETRLQASMDLDGQAALQDEIKAELRGTIAALEQRIAFMEERERMLWPDASARALGRIFAMALSAVRHAGGQDWREDAAAPVILAGVMRRVMDLCSRRGGVGSLFTSITVRERITATTEAVTTSLVSFIDATMPRLPPLQPQDDPANWTNRARIAVTYRDKATGRLLQVTTGPEYDFDDPEAVPDLGPDHRVAIDRFRPVRETVDVEDFIVHILKDGSTAWDSLFRREGKVHVPAGQEAPPVRVHRSEEPAFRQATPEEIAGMVDAPGQLPESIGGQAVFDDAVASLPLVQAEGAVSVEGAAEHATAPAPRRRAKAKA